MRFPARELKTHCDYVRAEDLIVGEVYFRVHFLDDEGLVPELLPREFVGRNLFPADEGGKSFLYFKEPDTSSAAASHGPVPADLDGRDDHEEDSAEGPSLECEEETEHSGVVDFDEALNYLCVPCAETRCRSVSEPPNPRLQGTALPAAAEPPGRWTVSRSR